ncbi:MAG TPA: alpha/beta hydrolase family protein [Bacteroidales bacterium]|nr:alpha/beta hydrolase family protein [Bacteroidales bacterium]
MKNHRFILAIGIVALFTIAMQDLQAQVSRGRVVEGLTIDSELLNKEVRYTVYLPFDYESSERYYPVVYLLHGYTDNDAGWIQFGEANIKADKAIATGEIPPMIIIMPDAGVSWYINNHDGSVPWENFFFKELVPHVEKKYRIRQEKRYRGIAGLSMGGFGSLVYSMKHPDMFAACAAFSAGLTPPEEAPKMDQGRWNQIFGPVYGKGLEGEERLTEHFLKNNPFHIARQGDKQKLRSVRYYIDCGDDDFLSGANSYLHMVMQQEEIPHEYRVRDGKHSWPYWRSGLIDGLKFIGQSFHQF